MKGCVTSPILCDGRIIHARGYDKKASCSCDSYDLTITTKDRDFKPRGGTQTSKWKSVCNGHTTTKIVDKFTQLGITTPKDMYTDVFMPLF